MGFNEYAENAESCQALIEAEDYASANIILTTALMPEAKRVARELHPPGDDERFDIFAGWAGLAKRCIDLGIQDVGGSICGTIVTHIKEAVST